MLGTKILIFQHNSTHFFVKYHYNVTKYCLKRKNVTF